MQQEMSQWFVFVKENSCRGFYSKTKSLCDPLVEVGFSLQGRNLVQLLHRTVSAKSRKSHCQHMWLWLDIKAFEFPRYGIYSFMTRSNLLQNQIRLSWLLYWLNDSLRLKSVKDRMHKEIKSIYVVLSEKKQSVVSRKQSVVFLQQQQCMNFKKNWEEFKTNAIVHM